MIEARIKEIIRKSHQRLTSADALLKIGNYADSISRSYYAVLDAARAVLINDKIYPKSHAGTIAQFHQRYIKTKKISEKFGKMLSTIEKARTEADYEFEVSFTKSEAKQKLDQAKGFVKQVEEYLASLN